MRTRTIFGLTIAGCAMLAMVAAGCHDESASRAAQMAEPTPPLLIRQQGQPELMELKPGAVPGAQFAEVRNVELP
ncbi:MAG TPA: hypothetical protein VNF29_02915, partial [Candidatus Binataceae bacterium]|nr:hypothetical protein [Candidatus Binataceae bacterium]